MQNPTPALVRLLRVPQQPQQRNCFLFLQEGEGVPLSQQEARAALGLASARPNPLKLLLFQKVLLKIPRW
jgi:hypothetical protein